jgi:hypothetical protein
MTAAEVVKAAHVASAFAAYGLPLAYPLLIPYLRRRHPDTLPGVHDAQHRFSVWLTGPFTGLLLAFGIYLATKEHQWGQAYVQAGIAAIAIIGVAGGLIVRDTATLSTLAADGFGAEYDRVYRRYLLTETALGALVLAMIFVMVVRP